MPLNAFSDGCEYDEGDPAGYRSGRLDASAATDALAVKVFELPPGEALCPYHYEYEEEWLLVLEGTAVVRTPAGEQALGRGAIMRFPPGPEGAHKVASAGDGPARVLMFSSARLPAVAVYPDSDKLGVWTPGDEDNAMVRRAEAQRDYWDGEPKS
jgi:uncharacterized cupin superfamily protein